MERLKEGAVMPVVMHGAVFSRRLPQEATEHEVSHVASDFHSVSRTLGWIWSIVRVVDCSRFISIGCTVS
jgi:hypothetical protein